MEAGHNSCLCLGIDSWLMTLTTSLFSALTADVGCFRWTFTSFVNGSRCCSPVCFPGVFLHVFGVYHQISSDGLWLVATPWHLDNSDSRVNLTYSAKVKDRLWSRLKNTNVDCWWEMWRKPQSRMSSQCCRNGGLSAQFGLLFYQIGHSTSILDGLFWSVRTIWHISTNEKVRLWMIYINVRPEWNESFLSWFASGFLVVDSSRSVWKSCGNCLNCQQVGLSH